MSKDKFYKNGLRFKCTGCGNCCKISDGYVRIQQDEMQEIISFLNITPDQFFEQFVHQQNEDGIDLKSHQDGACIFLENDRCKIYEVRPGQCRTFPFWPENMKSAYRWKLLKDTCEGIDQGNIIPYEKIRAAMKAKVAINSLPEEGVANEKLTITNL